MMTKFRRNNKVGAVLVSTALTLALILAAMPFLLNAAYAHSCDINTCIEEGRMTGGGRIDAAFVLTHGFELHCNPNDGPNNLEINWDGGNRFHLESVTDINCFDDPTLNPHPPKAPIDTLELSGFGRYNGESGAFVWVQFTDNGEPGKTDQATVVVYDADGNLVLDETGYLRGGNHQAHKA
jgi:hypothetical protein